LGAGIDPGMALTPFPFNIGRDLNPGPSNCESSTLTTRPDFCPHSLKKTHYQEFWREENVIIFLNFVHTHFKTGYNPIQIRL